MLLRARLTYRMSLIESVYCGVLYDGKQYPIELDIDSEREISEDEIWNV